MQIARLRSRGRRVADSAIALLFPGGPAVSRILWQVEGFLFPHEGVLLFQVGKHVAQGGTVVEIGSMRGLSTCCLAAGIRRAERPARLVAVDPHLYGSEPELRHNLRLTGAAAVVDVRVEPAEAVATGWQGEIAAVFIDGAHDLESVLRDYTTWTAKVRPGGFVLVHDSTPLSRFAGPAFVAETKIRVGETFDAVGRVGSISWGRKAGGGAWLPSLPAAPLVDGLIRIAKRGRSEPSG